MRLAGLRRPQREALDRVHRIMLELDDDIAVLSRERMDSQLTELGLQVPYSPPQMIFSLATGVGKTRLLGALAAYLYRSGQTRNIAILTPRRAILDKFERETQPASPKYLFIDEALLPAPNLCFRANVEGFVPATDRLNVFVLSPQSITGHDKRAAKKSEFRDASLLDYLGGLDDLVVMVDEAHHIAKGGEEETRAWTQSVRDLKARLYFGFTATPRTEAGANILFEYDLRTCLREGLYTKAVNLIVKERDKSETSDEDWDHSTLDFALQRLDRKRDALRLRAESDQTFTFVEPVLLVCARDTAHADAVGNWLMERRGLGEEEILITHSERSKTEDDIARLVSIDSPQNAVRVVVNVFELTEGWDVTNVYVIAPLRAMATFQGAVQSMGRGLRLPAGRRVGDPDVDGLDVLCFGRESLQTIVDGAIRDFGDDEVDTPVIGITGIEGLESDEQPLATKEIIIKTVRDVVLPIPSVRQAPAEVNLDFDVINIKGLVDRGAVELDLGSMARTGTAESLRRDFETVVRLVSSRVVADLRYLSDPLHGEKIEELVRRFLVAAGANPEEPLAADWNKVAVLVEDEVERTYRRQVTSYEMVGEADRIPVLSQRARVPESFKSAHSRVALDDWIR